MIPKTIFLYWNKGIQNAPYVVKTCIESIKYYSHTYHIEIIDDSNIGKYVQLPEFVFQKNFPIQLKADILRTLLLHKYGGIWLDATLMLNISLSEWLDDLLDRDFFTFFNYNATNFFLASEKEGYVISRMVDEFVTWSKNFLIGKENLFVNWQGCEYYCLWHIRFEHLMRNDKKFQKITKEIPRVCNLNCLKYLVHYGMTTAITDDIKHIIDNDIYPFFKLTYKYNPNDLQRESAIEYVIQHFFRKSLRSLVAGESHPRSNTHTHTQQSALQCDMNNITDYIDNEKHGHLHSCLSQRAISIEKFRYNSPEFIANGIFTTFDFPQICDLKNSKFHIYQSASPERGWNSQIMVPYGANRLFIRQSSGKKYESAREVAYQDQIEKITMELEMLKERLREQG